LIEYGAEDFVVFSGKNKLDVLKLIKPFFLASACNWFSDGPPND
jgi:hypothetical protein